MDAEILQQLILIRWLLAAILAIFLVLLGVAAWAIIHLSRAVKKMVPKPTFHTTARDLMEKGLYEDARTLIEKWLETHPTDAYAYLYHGEACEQLADFTPALTSLRKADELHPGWTEEYIAPLVATIEARMREDTQKGPRD